jgi:hypothetical protein
VEGEAASDTECFGTSDVVVCSVRLCETPVLVNDE